MRALLIVALLASTAHAEEPAPKPLPRVAVTVSPIHLALPVVELTAEVRITDEVAGAVILGAGSVQPEDSDERASVFELGFQGRYYVYGKRRHRAQVGAEVLFIKGESESGFATAEGVAIGPFVGYKFTAAVGFTFDFQLGVQRIGIGAENDAGQTASERDWIPLINLNLGWSF